jgi:hypothetical protein
MFNIARGVRLGNSTDIRISYYCEIGTAVCSVFIAERSIQCSCCSRPPVCVKWTSFFPRSPCPPSCDSSCCPTRTSDRCSSASTWTRLSSRVRQGHYFTTKDSLDWFLFEKEQCNIPKTKRYLSIAVRKFFVLSIFFLIHHCGAQRDMWVVKYGTFLFSGVEEIDAFKGTVSPI